MNYYCSNDLLTKKYFKYASWLCFKSILQDFPTLGASIIDVMQHGGGNVCDRGVSRQVTLYDVIYECPLKFYHPAAKVLLVLYKNV